MQAFISRPLSSLPGGYGAADAFGWLHESAHVLALHYKIYSADMQQRHADTIHSNIRDILKEKPSHTINEMWRSLVKNSGRLVQSARKFRDFEEAFATLYALGHLDRISYHNIETSLISKLKSNGILDITLKFAEYLDHGFDHGLGIRQNILGVILLETAELIFEFCARDEASSLADAMEICDRLRSADDMIQAVKTHTKRGKLPNLAEHSVRDFWTVIDSNYIYNGVRNLWELKSEAKFSNWFLFGSGSTINVGYSDGNIAAGEAKPLNAAQEEKVFLESLRQQLSQCFGVHCLFREDGKACCGRSDQLWNLFEKLPASYRSVMTPPECPRYSDF